MEKEETSKQEFVATNAEEQSQQNPKTEKTATKDSETQPKRIAVSND